MGIKTPFPKRSNPCFRVHWLYRYGIAEGYFETASKQVGLKYHFVISADHAAETFHQNTQNHGRGRSQFH